MNVQFFEITAKTMNYLAASCGQLTLSAARRCPLIGGYIKAWSFGPGCLLRKSWYLLQREFRKPQKSILLKSDCQQRDYIIELG